MQIGIGSLGAVAETLEKNKNPRPEDIVPILVGVFGFVFGIYLLIIVVALVLGTLTAFVYPLIVDRRLGAFDAIKLSFRAVMGNFFGIIGLMIVSQLIIFAGVMFFLCRRIVRRARRIRVVSDCLSSSFSNASQNPDSLPRFSIW
jgi:tellurite resistance protein TehA-like permease